MRKKLGANAFRCFYRLARGEFLGHGGLGADEGLFLREDPAILSAQPKIGEIPAGMLADAKKYREKLIEAVADCDDAIRQILEGAKSESMS